ncbi:MAG: hypothetical protein ACHQ1D_04865 [Nitrososphaerales archaeon]
MIEYGTTWCKKEKKQLEAILRYKIKYQRKDLTLQDRTVAKWIEYLTCYNGIGVNLVKVDGTKIKLLILSQFPPTDKRN